MCAGPVQVPSSGQNVLVLQLGKLTDECLHAISKHFLKIPWHYSKTQLQLNC